MRNRNKRILWLLNHKTLMPYEVKLLLELGFEVFTPKITPTSPTLRSCAIDITYDFEFDHTKLCTCSPKQF